MNVSVDATVLKNAISKEVNSSKSEKGILPLIASIDQGTSSSRVVLLTRQGLIASSAQMEHKQYTPQVGWHEHDPIEIWNNVVKCFTGAVQVLEEKHNIQFVPTGKATAKKEGKTLCQIKAVGLTNQRETTIVWNKVTGVPYHNAIVWDDVRTAGIASDLGHVDRLRGKTGLPLASYFAGTKVKWFLDNCKSLQKDLANPSKASEVLFGTIDTWLLFQLTGQKSTASGAANCKGIAATDVSNASRWLFVNLKKPHEWDQSLVNTVCAPHKLPVATALPKIYPSGHIFGTLHAQCGVPPVLVNTPVAGVLGDQQAALFGQTAYRPGEAKNTYGTGLFLMMNTGPNMIPSKRGLLTTVGYQLNKNEPVIYALEGSVSHSGSTIQWLRDKLQIISKASETEALAKSVDDENVADSLYLVPAFSGLFAPYWRPDARACIVGLTTRHSKAHVARAAVQAMAYQTLDVFESMAADAAGLGISLKELNVDGGATENTWMLQFQADVLDVPVVRPAVLETTALGAGLCAGLTVGVFEDLDELRELWAVDGIFRPNMPKSERSTLIKGWKKAVSKSMGWVDQMNKSSDWGTTKQFLGFLTAGAGLAGLGFVLGRSTSR